MTSRDQQLAVLRAALEDAEADVLRLAVQADDQAKAIDQLRTDRHMLLDNLDEAQVKARVLDRAIRRLEQQA